MLDGRTVSVCSPVLNEAFFLPIWMKNVSEFADEVLLQDGGSTDGSPEIAQEYAEKYSVNLKLTIDPQQGDPYSDDWDESVVRNKLLRACTSEYTMNMDVDEVVIPDDIRATLFMMRDTNKSLATLKMIPFWRDLYTVRLNTPTDPRWFETPISRVMVTGQWEYNEVKHHCSLQHIELGRSNEVFLRHVLASGGRLFHLHYGFGKSGVKFRDNRRGDLGDPDEIDEGKVEPDFSEKPKGNWGEVKMASYSGPWPDVLQEYL